MTGKDFSNLTGKVLIATPYAMKGNVFYKSLIYVLMHDDDCSIGFIFNHPLNKAPANKLFRQCSGQSIDELDTNLVINLGGLINVERGFFLHTNEYAQSVLFNAPESNLAVSSNVQILKDIINGTGPKNSLFIIGYTVWGAGQLESELENNLWLAAEPDHNLIFIDKSTEKWSKSLSMCGITQGDFAPVMAKC